VTSTPGLYGTYGGRYVPETLIPALDELEAGWRNAQADEAFHAELAELGRTFAGRPTPLTRAERFAPGKRLYLKREDLLHTGAHKLNNALGQAVLARRLGKRRIVAETGAGQHGVATATVCARFGLECVVSTFVIQSRIASLVASLSVLVPKSTGRTSAPSRFMRSTLGRWRRMSSSPM
jgi:tryptophan synthase beta chain